MRTMYVDSSSVLAHTANHLTKIILFLEPMLQHIELFNDLLRASDESLLRSDFTIGLNSEFKVCE